MCVGTACSLRAFAPGPPRGGPIFRQGDGADAVFARLGTTTRFHPPSRQVPFVDEIRLLAAAASVAPGSLSESERARNKLGSILVFSFDAGGMWQG